MTIKLTPNKMERYIYTVVITQGGGDEPGNDIALPNAYTSYDDALAALKQRFNRPWQGHDGQELFLEFKKSSVDWKTFWDSIPDEKKNCVKEGSKFYNDSYHGSDYDNITQIPIEHHLFVNIYRLRLGC